MNPDLMPTTVAVPVRDTSGLVIGTTSVPLAAKSKVAVVLSGLPGLSAMLGNRGSADFTVAPGERSGSWRYGEIERPRLAGAPLMPDSSCQGRLRCPSRHAIELPVDLDLAPVDFDSLARLAELRHGDVQLVAGMQGSRRTRRSTEAVHGFGSRQIINQAWHTSPLSNIRVLGEF